MKGFATLMGAYVRGGRNGARLLRRQSRLKLGFIVLFAGGMTTGLFFLFLEGFRFLGALGGVGLMLVHRMLGLFFWGLGVMMVLSGFVTAFAALFRSRETADLLVRPAGLADTALFKYVECGVLSSWAYFFIVVPFLGAYAWHERIGLLFPFWALLLSVPFVLLCAGIGLLCCLLFVRWMPRSRLLYAAPFVLLLAAAARRVFGQAASPEAAGFPGGALQIGRIVPGLRLASNPWWPSWWLAEGLSATARGQPGRAAAFAALLVTSALVLGLLVEAAGRRLLHPAWLRAQEGSARRRKGRPLLSRWPEAFPGLGRPDLRALAAKDLRVFVRDPVQWSQGLVFFALLGFYFLNLRALHYHRLDAVWRNLVVFLNVFSVSAVMCSFGARFVFPQLSLEGHAIWILGLSPAGIERALRAKFVVAWTLLTAISLGLTALSAHMLGADGAVRALALLVAAALAAAVSGLSVGLGAVFLDLRHQNPAAIVSGFGGTLNLILNLVVLVATILPVGALFHLRETLPLGPAAFRGWAAAAVTWVLALSAAAAVIPLRLGRRSLRGREY